jgi:predicted DNA-binding WGR domain protein
MTRDEQIQYVQTSLSQVLMGMSPFIRLENASASGGKFWEGRATDRHLIVTWGKVRGSQGTSKTFQRNQCEADNTIMELMSRATKKLQKGYHLVSYRNA